MRARVRANDIGLSRRIIRQVEESLKRLDTDYIDLYQIHNPDQLTDWEETLRALDDLVRSGKVRYIGNSNMAGWEIMKTRGISTMHGLHAFKSDQSYYSLAARDIEREIIPALKDQQMGLIVWSPLAGGFLTGKYTREHRGSSEDRHAKLAFPPIDTERCTRFLMCFKISRKLMRQLSPKLRLRGSFINKRSPQLSSVLSVLTNCKIIWERAG